MNNSHDIFFISLIGFLFIYFIYFIYLKLDIYLSIRKMVSINFIQLFLIIKNISIIENNEVKDKKTFEELNYWKRELKRNTDEIDKYISNVKITSFEKTILKLITYNFLKKEKSFFYLFKPICSLINIISNDYKINIWNDL